MIVRPYGIVLRGHLQLGLEVLFEGGKIVEVRPHTGIPDAFVLTPAFVNAHSHLEYRGMLGAIDQASYWAWIRELTRLKTLQELQEVREDTLLAARENRQAGIALIAEHSDRPFAGEAMAAAGLDGVIFQEIITAGEEATREAKLERVAASARENQAHFSGPVLRAPHAYFTVDRQTLREVASSGEPFSIHVAETSAESELTLAGEGLIAEFARLRGRPVEPTGMTVFGTLDALGLVRPGAQFVHCCDLDSDEVARLAQAQVVVAHCPRSNVRLECPLAPVREMLDAGVLVGLGLDSVASSGPIDMFAEMRAALHVAEERGRPLHPEEVWTMATSLGGESIARMLVQEAPSWEIELGSAAPLLKLNIPDAQHTEDLIRTGSPSNVEWLVV